MAQDNKRSAFTSVFLLAVFFQVIFVFADMRDTPGRAAVEFARLYYQLDSAMTTRLCDELALDEKNNVASYIQNTAKQANEPIINHQLSDTEKKPSQTFHFPPSLITLTVWSSGVVFPRKNSFPT